MKTSTIFNNGLPVVSKAILVKPSDKKQCITISRPYRYHNPFIKDSILNFQSVCTNLSRVAYFDEIVTQEFLEFHLPTLAKHVRLHSKINRKIAIELFKEFWLYCRSKGFITDKEVLKLKGKTLLCFCHPKQCHGDVLVDDYYTTSRKNSNKEQ